MLAPKESTLHTKLLIVTVLGILTGNSFAQDQDLATSAKLAYRAFECAHLASSQSDQVQKDRLFKLGITEARRAGSAYIRGEITDQDLSRTEIMTTFFMDGPSQDFIAGRLYEGAGNHVWINIKTASGGADAPLLDMRRITSRMYQDKNCELLGARR